MNDIRFFIPPDLVVGDVVSAAAPKPWFYPQLERVHSLGIDGRGVVISGNDTGCWRHPDLPEPVAKRDFTNSPSGADDRNGHGTHIAGTALGRNGIGVAPGATLIIAKVLSDQGNGSTIGINAAYQWSAEQGADVISCSYGDNGGPPVSEDLKALDKCYEAGASLVVAAAGNAGYNGANTIGRPGSYDRTFCVGSYRQDGGISNYSSGGRMIDTAAPGERIVSAKAGGGYVEMSGTSMATPFVAGLIALVIQRHRTIGKPYPIGYAAWRKFFADNGLYEDRGSPGFDERFGHGIILIDKVIDWLVEPKWL